MKRVFLALFVMTLAVAVAGSVFAQGRGPMGGPGMGPRCDITNAPGLNLSADQAAKIKTLQSSHFKDVEPVRSQMFTKRQELRQLWQQKTPDQAKIEAAQKDIQNLRNQLQSKQTQYRFAVLKELTPEQQDKIKASNWGCPKFGAGKKGGNRGGMMGPKGQGMGMGPGPAQQAQ